MRSAFFIGGALVLALTALVSCSASAMPDLCAATPQLHGQLNNHELLAGSIPRLTEELPMTPGTMVLNGPNGCKVGKAVVRDNGDIDFYVNVTVAGGAPAIQQYEYAACARRQRVNRQPASGACQPRQCRSRSDVRN
jgi:hypothetical protein